MSTGISYNDSEVRANIARFKAGMPPDVAEALNTVATAIFNEAYNNCPVRTGTLRASITKSKVFRKGALHEISVMMGEGLDYGIWVHEGTSRMAPNPFLQNALINHMGEIRRALGGILGGM